ncbi:MAG: hypothetical protein OES09_01630 [Gammaproteobacteria bacterium]|nr:hypothetical protein [Gammaproteobacteria bacterium]
MKRIFGIVLGLGVLSAPAIEAWSIGDEPVNDQRLERFLRLPMVEQKRIREEANEFRQLPQEEKDELCRKFEKEHGYLPPRCE